MSLRKKLGKVLLCVVLEAGALSGSIRPEEIEQLMNVMHRTQCVMRDDQGDDEDRVPENT